MAAEIHPTATVYPGTVLGDGVRVLEYAVVGKQPSLGAASTASRKPLPPAELADGVVVGSRAVQVALEGPDALREYVAGLRAAIDAAVPA